MKKKFELIKSDKKTHEGKPLFQVKALIDFYIFKKGDLGGYIEKEKNLSQEGNAWVSGNAWVHGNARVSGNAWVHGNARVYGDARVSGNAWVSGRFDLIASIDFELPRISIDSKEKLMKLKKFLEEFDKKE